MRPKWYQNGPRGGKRAEKKRKESRGETKVRSRASWERSGATSFDFAATIGYLADLEFRTGWALKVSKSVLR